MSTANQFDSFPRFHMDDELKERLDALSMTRNVSELREFGYTVIDNPAPIEFTERLRETIMRLVQETGGGGKGYAAALLVGRDPIFDEVLLNPKLMSARPRANESCCISLMGATACDRSNPTTTSLTTISRANRTRCG